MSDPSAAVWCDAEWRQGDGQAVCRCGLTAGHEGQHWCRACQRGIDRAEGDPLWYYGATECASVLGVTRQRISQLIAERSLPEPDVMIGRRRGWEPAKFDAFAIRRNEYILSHPAGHAGKVDP